MENNALIKTQEIQSLEAWGNFAMKSGVVPQGTTQAQAMAIIQTGREIGLQPMQALRSMSFIKGRLCMSVQLQLALARRQGVTVAEMVESEGMCEVVLKRESETITCQYTLADAKKAGLVRQDGNYDKYAKQMLRWRAIGDALRIIAPDTVMGLLDPIEAESIEPLIPAELPKADTPKPTAKPSTLPPVEKKATEQGVDKGKEEPKPDKSAYAEMLLSFKKAKEIIGEKNYRDILASHNYKKCNEIRNIAEGQKILNQMSDFVTNVVEAGGGGQVDMEGVIG